MTNDKFFKFFRIIFLLGAPGLISNLFIGQPLWLMVGGVFFGLAASILGSTTPEWRAGQVLRRPVPMSFHLRGPYLRMAAVFGLVALLSTIWFRSLIGTLDRHPMLNSQLYFFPAAMWGSTFSLLVLILLRARQEPQRP